MLEDLWYLLAKQDLILCRLVRYSQNLYGHTRIHLKYTGQVQRASSKYTEQASYIVVYLHQPVRALQLPLSTASVHSADLASMEAVGKLLERHRSRLRDVLVRSKLAIDRLERAELALHLTVTKIVIDTRLAATPDTSDLADVAQHHVTRGVGKDCTSVQTCYTQFKLHLKSALTLGCLLVQAQTNVLMVLHRACVAQCLRNRLFRKQCCVIIRPGVALRCPPAAACVPWLLKASHSASREI